MGVEPFFTVKKTVLFTLKNSSNVFFILKKGSTPEMPVIFLKYYRDVLLFISCHSTCL